MECFEGERDRTTRYEYRGFWYHADTNYPGRRYVCASKTVQNKCSVSVLVKNGIVEVRRKHTHPPPKSQKTHLATKQMKILAINELDLSPSDIMNRVFAEHKKAARLIKPHCAYNTISYARGRMLPRIPDTLTELVEIIDEFPENLISSYHGYFRSCDGKIGLVFTTAALLEAAGSRETCEIYIDGTFDVSSPSEAEQRSAISCTLTEKRCQSGALDEMVNQLEAELVDQEDPPDLQMTGNMQIMSRLSFKKWGNCTAATSPLVKEIEEGGTLSIRKGGNGGRNREKL
ncbi:hypothetical protein PV328_004607 [Microctonus aethiopoides]|uniref:FLYWCH-type domain-containing protein n=1 Tax=Microctonus aethiopoides TaxID=144406 RepID=A0AA39FAU8_9HYME|nr:hypothetical protein PV328_004607 [Microctonus aethiopoides]